MEVVSVRYAASGGDRTDRTIMLGAAEKRRFIHHGKSSHSKAAALLTDRVQTDRAQSDRAQGGRYPGVDAFETAGAYGSMANHI